MFSMDGYNAHISQDHSCYSDGIQSLGAQPVRGIFVHYLQTSFYMLTSHSAAPLHPATDSTHPPPELQPYACKSPFSLFEVSDDMLSKTGRAFLDWNSRVGVS